MSLPVKDALYTAPSTGIYYNPDGTRTTNPKGVVLVDGKKIKLK